MKSNSVNLDLSNKAKYIKGQKTHGSDSLTSTDTTQTVMVLNKVMILICKPIMNHASFVQTVIIKAQLARQNHCYIINPPYAALGIKVERQKTILLCWAGFQASNNREHLRTTTR